MRKSIRVRAKTQLAFNIRECIGNDAEMAVIKKETLMQKWVYTAGPGISVARL